MEDLNDKFYYIYSSSFSERVQIKMWVIYLNRISATELLSLFRGTLEGKRQRPGYEKLLADPMLKYSGLYQEGCADLVVVCQLFDQNQPLCLPVSTSYKAFTSRWK